MTTKPTSVAAAARGVAMVAGTLTAILVVLLLATFIQLELNEPIMNPTLEGLKQQLKADPENQELRDQIRAFDLLARKAYFTSQWQIRTGGWMLLVSVVTLLVALKLMGLPRGRESVVSVPAGATAEPWQVAATARRVLAVTGGVAVALLIGLAIIQPERSDTSASPVAGGIDLETSWPGFRGPGGNAVAVVDTAPTAWDGSSGEGIRWKVEVPLPGHSSPVVVDGKVILTGADKDNQVVYCFGAESGEMLWQTAIADVAGHPAKSPRTHSDTGLAAPSAATDGRSVFVIFASGDVAGLDLAGHVLWARNLGLPDNHYGHSSSLITHGRRLIVQYDQSSNSELLALDVASGETVWRVGRGAISWSSPILVDTGSREELILTNSTSVDAYDPVTGVKLWGVDCLGGEVGPSAAFADGMVFVANDYAVAAGLRLGPDGASKVWEFDEVLPDTASPVAAGGHVFLAASYGVVVCLDAATGDKLWELETDAGFYSSPVVVGKHVYLLDMDGVMHIFEAGPAHVEVASPALGEGVVTTPAFVGDRIYLRGLENLYCIEGT